MLSEQCGDLFEMNYRTEWSLCHCVSEDLAMGAGIAVMFKRLFGQIEALKAQEKKVGQVAFLASTSTDIYYLITKARYFDKPTYDTLETSLTELRRMMTERSRTKLAMPRIGSGLDGLDWNRVKEIIARVFADSGIQVVVCFK